MAVTKRWSVEIFIDELEGQTFVQARLFTDDDTPIVGVGQARLNPSDDDIPEIGDELATARALTDLGHRLLLTAQADITAVAGSPVLHAGR